MDPIKCSIIVHNPVYCTNLSVKLFHFLYFRRDHRDTWVLKQTEPVAGNYYPVNSRIYLKVYRLTYSRFCANNFTLND